nr:uncharacterized protein LOC106690428 isoform X1 [Halyomorpha halys]XP_014291352.1 uncharacterized protein LOC106690428 isoform X1 [Halyomorpha halys]XP_014291353.1 uncharacterized protein LOC106690428 isoform X1 [Halyomorpha halys]
MGSPWEDVEIAIIHPFLSVFLFLLIWVYVISKMCKCIIGLSDKMINQLVLTGAYLAALQRTTPYDGAFIPTPHSTEMVLLFSASYYLKTAFCSDSKTDISYNLMIFITILDIVSFKKGGDTTLYLLSLLEAPDSIGAWVSPFLRTEACFDVIYTVLYLAFKIFLLGHIIYNIIMNSKISEDIKMNVFIVYLYSVVCLPAMLISCYQFCTGDLDYSCICLPQISRKKLEVPRGKPCRRRSYSRARRR